MGCLIWKVKEGKEGLLKRRTKILLIVLGSVAVLSLIVGGVMVLADSGSTTTTTPSTTTGTSPNDAFLTALAAKLNIPVDTLKTAIKDAQTEVQGQALKDRLQKLVDAGKMTQDQMDQYLQWWNSKPAFSNNISPNWFGGGRPGFGMMGGRGHVGGGFRLPKTTTTTTSPGT